MDDDSIKQRFQELEKSIVAIEKRVDEAKVYAGGIAGFFTIWFAVLTLVLSSNYNSDKESLREFQKQMREDLGKSVAAPELELLGLNDKLLDGQTISATYRRRDSNNSSDTQPYYELCFNFAIRNSGNETTGPMTTMLYTSDPIRLGDRSVDEPDFNSVCLIEPKYNSPSEIPGKLTSAWSTCCGLSGELPAPGQYAGLVKFFYGKGKLKTARVRIGVPAHP
jgi:hypothetical protein